ncbi:MAG: hypothetical protein HN978_18155 [Desulfobacula sp.]|nr:hypothetical protein [Desulfobacula sp.]
MPTITIIVADSRAQYCVIVQPVKKIIPKALSDGYLQEFKRIASKQISIRQGGFKRKS